MRVFWGFLVGFASLLLLLPFLLALTGDNVLLIELVPPHIHCILADTLVAGLLTSDDGHQVQTMRVAIHINHSYFIGIRSCNGHYSA